MPLVTTSHPAKLAVALFEARQLPASQQSGRQQPAIFASVTGVLSPTDLPPLLVGYSFKPLPIHAPFHQYTLSPPVAAAPYKATIQQRGASVSPYSSAPLSIHIYVGCHCHHADRPLLATLIQYCFPWLELLQSYWRPMSIWRCRARRQ